MKPSIQWIRHTVQILVLLGIITVPLLSQYRVFLSRNQIETIRSQDTESLPRTVLLKIDTWLQGSVTKEDTTTKRIELTETLGRVQGNHWSGTVFGIPWIDPLAAFESMSASRKITVTLILGLILPVVLTVVFGRVFCSWMCPAGLLFEIVEKIRSIFHFKRHSHNNHSFWRGNKYVLLFTGLIFAFVFSIPLLGYLYPPALIGREIGYGIRGFFDGLGNDPQRAGAFFLTGTSLFLLSIIMIEIFVSKRMWCRHLCPGGGLYSLLGSLRLVKLKNDESRCTQCMECVSVCPMALKPLHHSPGIECDLCMLCVGHCEPKSLSLQFSLPLANAKTKANQEPVLQGKEA